MKAHEAILGAVFRVYPPHFHNGEDDPDGEQIFRGLWEDETQRDVVIESLKADCVRSGGGGLRAFEISSDQRRLCGR